MTAITTAAPLPSDLVTIPQPRAYRLVNHGSVVVLTTHDGHVHNGAPVAWLVSADFDPPLFLAVISAGQKTQLNLAANGECVINIPTASQVDLVRRLGDSSGNDGPKLADVPLFPAQEVGAACIAGCLGWIEARVEKVLSVEHEVYLLRGVRAVAPRSAVNDQWQVIVAKWPTLHHLGGGQFGVCERSV